MKRIKAGETAIKLFVLDTLENGTQRLQSQLYFGKQNHIADFIMAEGILKEYRKGENGFGFYETDIPYILVTDPKEMQNQKL